MIKDITIGQYLPGDSILHRLDPRVKIILSMVYIINLFIINSFIGYLYVTIFTAMVIIISDIPFRYILKSLKPILWILIFTAILNAILTPGEVVYFKLGPFSVTDKGVYLATFMVIRIVFLIVGTSVLTLTTSPIALTDGIELLLNPFKRFGMPAHELAMMMTIALRFIPTLMDETDKIIKAQKARGADFETGSIIDRAKNLIPILVPLFINSFRRADELALAMEARCYKGGEGRTRMKQFNIEKNDYISAIVMILFTVVLILSRR